MLHCVIALCYCLQSSHRAFATLSPCSTPAVSSVNQSLASHAGHPRYSCLIHPAVWMTFQLRQEPLLCALQASSTPHKPSLSHHKQHLWLQYSFTQIFNVQSRKYGLIHWSTLSIQTLEMFWSSQVRNGFLQGNAASMNGTAPAQVSFTLDSLWVADLPEFYIEAVISLRSLWRQPLLSGHVHKLYTAIALKVRQMET